MLFFGNYVLPVHKSATLNDESLVLHMGSRTKPSFQSANFRLRSSMIPRNTSIILREMAPIPKNWQTVTTYNQQFVAGFFDTSTKKFTTSSMWQYELPMSRLLKPPAAPDPNTVYLRPAGVAALVYPKKVSVPMNVVITNKGSENNFLHRLAYWLTGHGGIPKCLWGLGWSSLD